jgi:hypothetical protein
MKSKQGEETLQMGMILISEPVSREELREAGEELFGDMVKAVVDIERQLMAAGAELHSDEEALLLERESRQENLWGINLYTERTGPEMIEFDSMINLRPRQNNRSRGVEDEAVRERIINVVNKLVK